MFQLVGKQKKERPARFVKSVVWRKFCLKLFQFGENLGEGRGGYEEQKVGNVGKQEQGKSGNGRSGCKKAGCRGNQESQVNQKQILGAVRKEDVVLQISRNYGKSGSGFSGMWGNWTSEKLRIWYSGMWECVCSYCPNHVYFKSYFCIISTFGESHIFHTEPFTFGIWMRLQDMYSIPPMVFPSLPFHLWQIRHLKQRKKSRCLRLVSFNRNIDSLFSPLGQTLLPLQLWVRTPSLWVKYMNFSSHLSAL